MPVTDEQIGLLNRLLAELQNDNQDAWEIGADEVIGQPSLAALTTAIETLETLPLTADGVRVVPGSSRVWWPKAGNETDAWIDGISVSTDGFVCAWTYSNVKRGDDARTVRVDECYSTKNAAQAAAGPRLLRHSFSAQ